MPESRTLWMPFSGPAEADGRRCRLTFVRGDGVMLYDQAGREYLDGVGALEAMAVGHGRKRLAEVAARQMRELAFLDVFRYTSPPALELADKLVSLAPAGISQVQFTPGGSEAVEVAIKLAFQYHHLRGESDRRLVLCRQGAYHGVTFGAMNCDGDYFTTRNDIYLRDQRFGRVVHGPVTASDWGLGGRHTAGVEQFEGAIHDFGPDNVAAIIVDGAATASAVAVPPQRDLAALRALCDRYGILLIVDEVITGFGRTGAMFLSSLHGVAPDLMPVSKALSSGYLPIGACLISDKIVDIFRTAIPDRDQVFAHGHTYGGHPVACAVARENIAIIEEEGLADRAAEMGGYLRDGLAGLAHHPTYVDVRGIGMITGLEVLGSTEDAGQFGTQLDAAYWLRDRCRQLGLLTIMLHPGTVFLLAPPLIIDAKQIDRLVEIVDRALTDLERRR
jgi:adenosylmethionine-8-amino-7-oxononanoate aminotransferase